MSKKGDGKPMEIDLSETMGQNRERLFDIDIDHIIPCEMHAMMRITDRLEAGKLSLLLIS